MAMMARWAGAIRASLPKTGECRYAPPAPPWVTHSVDSAERPCATRRGIGEKAPRAALSSNALYY